MHGDISQSTHSKNIFMRAQLRSFEAMIAWSRHCTAQ